MMTSQRAPPVRVFIGSRKQGWSHPDGIAYDFACSLIWLGEVLNHEGRAEEARPEVTEGIALLRRLATNPNANTMFVTMCVDRLLHVALLDLRDPTTAVKLLDSLVARSEEVDSSIRALLAEAREKAGAEFR